MPIRLDDLKTTSNSIKLYTPKFFSNKLTGSGKKTGLLNEYINPLCLNEEQINDVINNFSKYKFKNGDTEIENIPLTVMTKNMHDSCINRIINVNENCVKMAEYNNSYAIYLTLKPLNIEIEETTSVFVNNKRKVKTTYEVIIFRKNNTNSNNPMERQDLYKVSSSLKGYGECYYSMITNKPIEKIINIQNEIKSYSYNGIQFFDDDVTEYLTNYSLYDCVCEEAKNWNENVADIFSDIIMYNNNDYNMIKEMISYLDSYKIQLEQYKKIYDSIKKNMPSHIKEISKKNLNLLLADTMEELNNKKSQLNTFVENDALKQEFLKDNPKYSKEQINAITSTEPLTLVQAGAGTGKSTVILGRIDYLTKLGVDEKDITVLSFTNAAADNITARNPNLNSMTIAKMIHNIYSNTYKHEISTIDTVMNMLRLYNTNKDSDVMYFINLLRNVKKSENNAMVKLSEFVEENFDFVMNLLNNINQTTLELEIIIAYLKLDTLKVPDEVKSKYLIIDEVQDNSIFEFVYTLKYTEKYNQNLFIVGDCSQTLYEFRASNPRALNVLEMSNVFATFSLQTNYRSNQEILDFANIVLENIEANKFANIQLRANLLNKVSFDSFTEKVKHKHILVSKMREFNQYLTGAINTYLVPFINDKIKNKEKVAVLAYTRQHISQIEEVLKIMYPNLNIVNIIPAKTYASTLFTDYLNLRWKELSFANLNKPINMIIARDLIDNLNRLVRDNEKAINSAKKQISEWLEIDNRKISSWQNQYLAGIITLEEFLNLVKDSMVTYEVNNNAIKQSLISQRNANNKNEDVVKNADILLSTIHSAKGLEFDNTIVFLKILDFISEEEKRMIYVALTRAMKSEFVLTYGNYDKPPISSDYTNVLKKLNEREGNKHNITQVYSLLFDCYK